MEESEVEKRLSLAAEFVVRMQRWADKASQNFLATKQYLGIQLRLQRNIDTRKG